MPPTLSDPCILADWTAKAALYELATDPRFVKFAQLPVVIAVEIDAPAVDEDLSAYEARVIRPAMKELIAGLPDDLVQFLELRSPTSAEEASRARSQGLSVQYMRHFHLVRGAMVGTLAVAYIPKQA